MLRYSLGSLFLALLYLSIGCAALVNATGMWPQVAVTMSVAMLVLFSLGAIFWAERRQVFSIGFSVTGWLYFLLVFSSVANIRPYLLTDSATHQLLITMHSDRTQQFSLVYQSVTTPGGPTSPQNSLPNSTGILRSPSVARGNAPGPLYAAPAIQTNASGANSAFYLLSSGQPTVDLQSFSNIGHSLWTIIVAFVGGITAQLLARSRRRADVVEHQGESSA